MRLCPHIFFSLKFHLLLFCRWYIITIVSSCPQTFGILFVGGDYMNRTAIDNCTSSKINISRLLLLCLAVGITVGVTVSFCVSDTALESLCSVNGDYLYILEGRWLLLFLRYFLVYQFWLTLEFATGFGAFYQPICCLVIMSSGFSFGILLRGICLTSAVWLNALCFLPWKILMLIFELMQSENSVCLADMYLSISLTNENRLGLNKHLREYVTKFSVYTLACAVISALRVLTVCLYIS